MTVTQTILEEWLERNQFVDGPSEGQFGTNTMPEERRLYHHPDSENIYTTPQMFMTYLGTLCLLQKKKKFSIHLDRVSRFLDNVFQTGHVQFPHNPRTSQQIDSLHEEDEHLVSYRHTFIGLCNSIVLGRNHEFVTRSLISLTSGSIQNGDGGWPLSDRIYVTSDFTTSTYFLHLAELSRTLDARSALATAIEDAAYGTLEYIKREFDTQYKNNLARMIRTIPSFYTLAFESFVRVGHPLLHRVPELIREEILDDTGWVRIDNSHKVHRYTIRYCNCLLLASLVNNSFYDEYRRVRDQVMQSPEYPALNTFEIFVLLNLLNDKRPAMDKTLKVLDMSLPLLNLIPGIGGAVHSYVERLRGKGRN